MTTAATAFPSTTAAGRLLENPWAKRLGYLGVLPFAFGAFLIWFVRADVRPYVSNGLSAYAAVIVSFLGGIHWGLAMRRTEPALSLFTWGVTPALFACIAVIMPAYAGLVVHGVLLAVCYAVDRKVYPAQGVGVWLKLRFRLTGLAALCCFVGAAGS